MKARIIFLRTFSIIGLAAVTGCQNLPPADDPKSAQVLDLSRPLETQEFRLTPDPLLKPVRLVVANSADDTSGHGASGNYAEIARTDLTEILANCANYVVVSRSVNRQAAAESKLRQATGARSTSVPVSPEFIVKASVMQVEREVKSDGTKTAWNYLISAESGKAQRQGAVEVLVEVIGLDQLTTLFAARSYGLLYDTTEESSVGLPIVATARKTTTRVPERQAIRTACQEAAQKVHNYFKSKG